jgi:hypothetical protein
MEPFTLLSDYHAKIKIQKPSTFPLIGEQPFNFQSNSKPKALSLPSQQNPHRISSLSNVNKTSLPIAYPTATTY